MKKSLILIWVLFTCTLETCPGQTVYSLNLDPAVEAAIRKAIDKPETEGGLTIEDVANVTTLDLSGKGLKTVDLPPYFFGLTTLNLQTNELKTLILPEGLNSLTNVAVQGNPLISLLAPLGYDLGSVKVLGFEKADIAFYLPFYFTVENPHFFTLEWSQGVLQSRNTMNDPWVKIEGAAGRILINTDGPQKYFRVISSAPEP